jgi:hypothetical protein
MTVAKTSLWAALSGSIRQRLERKAYLRARRASAKAHLCIARGYIGREYHPPLDHLNWMALLSPVKLLRPEPHDWEQPDDWPPTTQSCRRCTLNTWTLGFCPDDWQEF